MAAQIRFKLLYFPLYPCPFLQTTNSGGTQEHGIRSTKSQETHLMLKRYFDLAIAHKLATSFALNQNGQRIQAPKRRMPAIQMLTSHRVLSLSRLAISVKRSAM